MLGKFSTAQDGRKPATAGDHRRGGVNEGPMRLQALHDIVIDEMGRPNINGHRALRRQARLAKSVRRRSNVMVEFRLWSGKGGGPAGLFQG